MIRSSAIRKEEIFLFQKNITFLLTDRHAVGRQKNREKRGMADLQWHTDNKLRQLYSRASTLVLHSSGQICMVLLFFLKKTLELHSSSGQICMVLLFKIFRNTPSWIVGCLSSRIPFTYLERQLGTSS